MQPNILTKREYKDKIYVKNNRKNLCRILTRIRIRIRYQLKSETRPDPKKINSDPQHCQACAETLYMSKASYQTFFFSAVEWRTTE
jgi:hypothetical protein